MDERELIERVRAGDAGAERELYDAHVDLTQDTFVRAFGRLGQFRGDAAFSTWLRSVATSVILNGLRKIERIRTKAVDLEEAGAIGTAPRRTEPELRERLEAAIDALPDKYRLVVVMHDVEGYTHKEIADALGVATGTSKARLSRARARLRDQLVDLAEDYV